MEPSAKGAAKRALNAPLLHVLKKRMETVNVSLHVPGHKLGRQVLDEFRGMIGNEALKLDYSEIEGLDYLSCPTNILVESQGMAAAVFGAERTFYLINGTTVGILASILATCPRDSVCVMARNCHIATYNGVKLAGCTPAYLMPEYDSRNGICHGVTPAALEQKLMECATSGSRVGSVCIVSPTYFGAVSDIRSIAEVCHRYDVPLIVDEAHGAHFKFHDAFLEDSLSCGADIVIQSTHKVLTSLTQSSMLHIKSSLVDAESVAEWLTVLQSSSPSHLLMASLEAAALHATQEGVFNEPVLAARMAARGLRKIPGLSVLSEDHCFESVAAFDPLRVCANVSQWGVDASVVYDDLDSEFGIVPEITTPQLIVFAFGPGSVRHDAQQLIDAMQRLSDRYEPQSTDGAFVLKACLQAPPMEVSPSVASSSESRRVALEDSVAMTCAELISAYPPAIPLVVPGEKISQQLIEHLTLLRNNGANLMGASDLTLSTILVLC